MQFITELFCFIESIGVLYTQRSNCIMLQLFMSTIILGFRFNDNWFHVQYSIVDKSVNRRIYG